MLHICILSSRLRVAAYVDEAGKLKRLPVNSRAADIARVCGFENVLFYGDVYIGRYTLGSRIIIPTLDVT